MNIKSPRRFEKRSSANQEARFVMRNPYPDSFIIRRSLSESSQNLLSTLVGKAVDFRRGDEVAIGDQLPTEGVEIYEQHYINVIAQNFPKNIAKALAIGRCISQLEAEAGEEGGLSSSEKGLRGKKRVKAWLGGLVMKNGRNGSSTVGVEVYSPSLTEHAKDVYSALEPLGVKVPNHVADGGPFTMNILKSIEHPLAENEFNGLSRAFDDQKKLHSQDQSIYLGATLVLPSIEDIRKYNR